MNRGEYDGRSPVEKRLAWINDELTCLENKKLRRRLSVREGPQSARCWVDGRELINFGSNDYLALAGDPRLAEAVAESLQREGWGSGASPLVTGHAALHERLACRIAEFEGAEAALVFSSGFAANAGAVAALVGPGDVVYGDEKNHASLWDGCRLSRADVRAYPHGDADRLTALLAKSHHYRRRLVVTDGLFSMDGDLAPLPALVDLAERYDAMLLVDEAHATGVFG
ncbi:MAG: aminotransferase class I/II-fold pyridoxal phosphate-dependent enzyme, partial [Thermoguttaceae bacterium]